ITTRHILRLTRPGVILIGWAIPDAIRRSVPHGLLSKMSTHSAELTVSEQQSLERERVFDAFRRWGYLDANLNPFGGPIAGGYTEIRELTGDAVSEARRIYCGSIGAEFMHLPQVDRREWIQEQMEHAPAQKVDRRWLAERLLQADLFEQILQTRY